LLVPKGGGRGGGGGWGVVVQIGGKITSYCLKEKREPEKRKFINHAQGTRRGG